MHPAFRLVGRSHHCSCFTHIRRHTSVSCHFWGMRASRIPCLSGASLAGLSRPQLQPIHPTGAIPNRLRLLLPGSESSLGSDLLSRSASWGGFPSCKITRYFNPPSASGSTTATPPSAVAMPAAALEPAPRALALGVMLHHCSLSLTMMSSPRRRASDAVLAPSRPPWLVFHPRNRLPRNRNFLHSDSQIKMVFRHPTTPWLSLKKIALFCEGWQLCHPSRIHGDFPTPAGCCSQLQHHQSQAGSA